MQNSHDPQRNLPEDAAALAGIHRAFNAALAAFQGEMKAARRDGKNPHFRTTYATLASVIEAVQPACKHGLSHTQTIEPGGDGILLVTTLRHRDGFEVRSELPIAIGNDWQKFGSAFTYARRYALMGIYGIASSEDDDDGANATQPAQRRQEQRVAEATATQPSITERRAKAITESLAALHDAQPDAIKPLVEEFKAAFNIPAKTQVARSLDKPEHLAWFEEKLGLSALQEQPAQR